MHCYLCICVFTILHVSSLVRLLKIGSATVVFPPTLGRWRFAFGPTYFDFFVWVFFSTAVRGASYGG